MSTKAPDLEWLEGDVPRAGAFDDTYFSKAGGLAETRHVFLAGNCLPERFAGRATFTIAEFGFGTGLNFLATLDALNSLETPPGLTFLSFEMYPMTGDQLVRALSVFPDISGFTAELLKEWDPHPGWNRMTVANTQLVLGIGDARELIRSLRTPGGDTAGDGLATDLIDAWYLDGFSPAKNPELWDPDLLQTAADLTAPDGTLATYTAAGWVRRNLEAAGFAIQKVPGFAGKREMVVGSKAGRVPKWNRKRNGLEPPGPFIQTIAAQQRLFDQVRRIFQLYRRFRRADRRERRLQEVKRVRSVPGTVTKADKTVQSVSEHVRPVVVCLEAQVDLRVLIDEGVKAWQQPARCKSSNDTDGQDFLKIAVLKSAEGGAHALKGIRHDRQKRLAFVGQDDTPRQAFEQSDAKHLLQRFDLMADGGLRDAQFQPRTGETVQTRGGFEGPQRIERQLSGGQRATAGSFNFGERTQMLRLTRNFALGGALLAGLGLLVPLEDVTAAEFDPAPLATAVQDAESRLSARIGVSVMDLETGQSWQHRADERFPTNSTFKAFLCAALLDAGDKGTANPEREVVIRKSDIVSYSPVAKEHVDGDPFTIRELCEITVTISDNAAANHVMKELGGPEAVTAFLRSIGDDVTRVDRWEPDSNTGIPGDARDTTSPNAAAATLKKLVLEETLSEGARQTLTGWLIGNKVGNATLRAGLPEGWRIADKTGAGANGSRNNIAVIWPDGRKPVVIAIYITQTAAFFDARNAAIAKIGRALAESLN
eukprot:g1260.t1